MAQERDTTHVWKIVQAWLDVLDYPPAQARIAKRLGVTRQTVSQWKWGDASPTPEHLQALADEMTSVLGPRVYERLLEALNRDQGYLPDGRRQTS